MNTERSSSIELLNKNNYEIWQIRMKAVLQRHDKWGYVSGSIAAPRVASGDRAAESALNKWKENDEKAMAEIILSVGETELRSISKCTTSKEAWEKLQSIHASKSPVRKIELLTDITSFKMEDDEDFRERLDKFSSAVEQLEGMKIEIPNDMLVVLILKGLPQSYENFRCAIRSKDDLPNTEVLIGKILDEQKSRRASETAEDNNALYAGSRYNKNRQQGKQKDKTKRNKQPCFVCGSTDHWARRCPERGKNSAKNVNSHGENLYIEVARSEEAKNVSSKTRWCLDSGSTTHMCASEESMTDIQECIATLNMANSASTTAKARGVAHLKAATNDGNVDLNLHNTLLVKDLRTNLLSVSKITQHDREVLFRRDKAIIRDLDGNVRLIADRIGDLYYLREAGDQARAVMTKESHTTEAGLWHARLGHLHMDAVVNLSQGRAKGIQRLSGGRSSCDVCQRGKLTVKPFTSRAERSSKLLEIIHSDLCQPSKTRSEGGNRYFITFTDDFSGWCEIYLLKSKDQAFDAFKSFKNYVEKQTGKKIKALQSDNGREYCNKKFDDYLRQEGIQRRLTTPYTPQQNGVAERMNRTIVDMARCLLIQSGLPTMCWGEAINTANYLRNRCPSRSHDGVTPYELWHGRLPNLKHLRVFGAKAYVLEKGPNRRKLEDKSVEGRLVGYSRTAKAYRVRRNDTGKVVETRDVSIVEESTMKSRGESRIDFEYLHSERDDPEPGRVTRQERVQEEHVKASQPRRAAGRPTKEKTGKRGRPRKLYRYVSISSIASDHASSRENLSQGEDISQEHGEEVDPDDVFERENDENQSVKRPLETSLVPVDKRARNERGASDPGNFSQGSESLDWKRAIAEEVRSHLEHGTWEIVKRPNSGRVIGSRVILKNDMIADILADRGTDMKNSHCH